MANEPKTKKDSISEAESVDPEEVEMEDATKKPLEKIFDRPSGESLMPLLTKQCMASLQENLRKLLGHPSEYVESLPEPMKKRVKALKKLQLKYSDLEAEFYKEVHDLEQKYHEKHIPLYEKRKLILSGKHEPTEEECDFKEESALETPEGLSRELADKAKVEDKDEPTKRHSFDDSTKGIPDFWLTIFKNVDLLSEMLQEHDEPILSHLQDIQLKFLEDRMGFILEFHFAPNEYFTNKILTKTYEMRCSPDPEDPFNFEGPEIIKCEGCEIDWKKDKNVTVKLIKKKQKHKSRAAVRTVTKTVPRDSFFNFFSPPEVPEDEEDLDSEEQVLLTADFEIGHYIRERIVPRAVLFYTGEALDDDEDYEEDEDDEEEGEEEEEEEDDE